MASDERGTPVELRVLGPLEVAVEGAVLPIGGARQRALLASLALSANRVVSRERLIDALWGEEPPETASNALQVAVHGLRKVLGAERIERRGDGYVLHLRSGELDLGRFEELVARASGEAPETAAETLAAALALWRGPPLGDVGAAPFATGEAARLEELRLAALEASLDARLESGASGLVPELERLKEEHPYRERFRRQLMLALYREGRQADALDEYRGARSALLELGIDPSPELQELERAILRHDEALLARRVGREVRLPVPPAPIVGRELELAAITSLLAQPDVRLLTLTGPGGTGKTRLALEAAWQLAEELEETVFVDLAPIADHRLVVASIAGALGAEPTLDAAEARVHGRRVLLLLDNFEHVEQAAPAIGELLSSTPLLRALVTSRGRLHLAGEHEYPVPPLPVPEPGLEADLDAFERSQAVQLFLARARASRPGYEVTGENAPAVGAICRALEGLPLALELAAARLRMLSTEDLLGRLTRRLEALTGGPRDAPVRQRTLRATIDWSFELLSPEEQEVFRRLAVFRGGFDLAAAGEVAGSKAETLEALVERSLLLLDAEAARFGLLETVREYALERLESSGELEAVARRHAEHYLRMAEEAGPVLLTAEGGPWLARLDREHDNLRAALAAARDLGLHDLHLLVCGELWRFWYLRAYFAEGRRWLESALEDGEARPPTLRAAALKSLGILANEHGDAAEALRRADEALGLYRELGDERGVLSSLTVLGNAAMKAGEIDRARTSFEESGAIARNLDRPEDVAVSLSNLASIALKAEDFEGAEELLGESLAIMREAGREDAVAVALLNLGYARVRRGRPGEAVPVVEEGIAICSRLGFRATLLSLLVVLAAAAAELDAPQAAARLLGAAHATSRSEAEPLTPNDPDLLERTTEATRACLGDEAFAAAFEAGRSDPEGTIAEAAAGMIAS
jgi:predicted ATPase/DNA-binding SARP family transcriptional activator